MNMLEFDKRKRTYKKQTSYDLYISSNNDRHPVTETD